MRKYILEKAYHEFDAKGFEYVEGMSFSVDNLHTEEIAVFKTLEEAKKELENNESNYTYYSNNPDYYLVEEFGIIEYQCENDDDDEEYIGLVSVSKLSDRNLEDLLKEFAYKKIDKLTFISDIDGVLNEFNSKFDYNTNLRNEDLKNLLEWETKHGTLNKFNVKINNKIREIYTEKYIYDENEFTQIYFDFNENDKIELLTKLKNYMDLYDSNLEDFEKNYHVTNNIVDLNIHGELYKNVNVFWATNDINDYVILIENGGIYSDDDVEIIF